MFENRKREFEFLFWSSKVFVIRIPKLIRPWIRSPIRKIFISYCPNPFTCCEWSEYLPRKQFLKPWWYRNKCRYVYVPNRKFYERLKKRNILTGNKCISTSDVLSWNKTSHRTWIRYICFLSWNSISFIWQLQLF